MKATNFRWYILVLISLMYLICYMDRSNIAVAQLEIAKQLGLSKAQMGIALAAFTWAYAIAQVPMGWLGDRFGARKVLTWVMVCVGLSPIMTGASMGFNSLFGARVGLGLSEAGAFPVASRGMQIWFAKSERGRIQGITHLFSRLAVVVTPILSITIMVALGWRAIFYIFGLFGIVWAIAFYFIYRDNPEDHKSVNRAELAKIRGLNEDGSLKTVSQQRQQVPWKLILHSKNMWYIALGYCCFFFGTNFYLTWYPTYLREYRHMSLKSLGLLGTLPLIAGMLGDVVGGSLSDLIYKKTRNSKFARRVVAAPGFLLAAAFVIPAARTNSSLVSVLCLAASFFSLELVIGPAWAVPMDVGGQFSGTVTSIMNMAGALAASFTAIIYGSLFGKGLWVAPFIVTAGVMTLGALIWIFLINPEQSVVGAEG
jgi:sugar phosphate permease